MKISTFTFAYVYQQIFQDNHQSGSIPRVSVKAKQSKKLFHTCTDCSTHTAH